MKERFTRKPVLAALDLDKNKDGSRYTRFCNRRGIVNMMLVAYLSKSLDKMERNYEIHNKEILAVIRELENWRYLLEDTKFRFKVWTDYKNLEYFMKAQKLNCKQAR